MASNQEQFIEIQRKNLESATRLAQFALQNAQQVMALQTELAQSLLNGSLVSFQAQASAKDPQEMMSLRAGYVRETTQRLLEAAGRIAEIGNASRAEFSRLLTEQLASGNQEMSEAFQSFLKTLPGSNPQMLDVMQQAMQTAAQAFEQVVKTTTAGIPKSTKKK
ncbi:MAG: phasin family protein [Rhodocyclaceae bacterium]|jgi:phasin family protein|nr:phasin family protein [Rhodocyclaceae bacterium]